MASVPSTEEPFGEDIIPSVVCSPSTSEDGGTHENLAALLVAYRELEKAIQQMEERHAEVALSQKELELHKTEQALHKIAKNVQEVEATVLASERVLHQREHEFSVGRLLPRHHEEVVHQAEHAVTTARGEYRHVLQEVVQLSNMHEAEQQQLTSLKGLVSLLHQAHARETQLVRAIFDHPKADLMGAKLGELVDAEERLLAAETNQLGPQLAAATGARTHAARAHQFLDVAAYELAQARHDIVKAVGPAQLGLPADDGKPEAPEGHTIGLRAAANALFSHELSQGAHAHSTSPPSSKESLWERIKGHSSPPKRSPRTSIDKGPGSSAAPQPAQLQVPLSQPPSSAGQEQQLLSTATDFQAEDLRGGVDLLLNMDSMAREMLAGALSKVDMAVQNVAAARDHLPNSQMLAHDMAPQLSLLVGHVAFQHLSKGHLPINAVVALLQRAAELERSLRAAEVQLEKQLTSDLNPAVDQLQQTYTSKRATLEQRRRKLIQHVIHARGASFSFDASKLHADPQMANASLAGSTLMLASAAVDALNTQSI